MRWQRSRASDNVEDRRGTRGGLGGKGLGAGAIVLVLLAMLLGVDPGVVLNLATGPQDPGASQPAPLPPAGDEAARFVTHVLGDTEDTWRELFARSGRKYTDPGLVLFSGSTATACGMGQAAMGPFYCPGDHKVYIDLEFFQEMKNRFAAPGDFAQAYVIGHEVAHHVQNLLGLSDRVQAARQRSSQVEANRMSVRLELQADCLAGVWAHHADRTRQILESGDVEEALNAASAIGDDRLQRQAQGRVVPDSFTHGTSQQRVQWFRRGLESGEPRACDTFSAADL
ncbi:MAG TPA: neutral zinc metallopeptidase [Thiobacillaceae bacterium]|nr:neutral zinc metallopeptidase [Thiobacillaceae bacterium]HNU63399.1 neutral zinc metallopeptidase [Thiobacillaceae bacterium]